MRLKPGEMLLVTWLDAWHHGTTIYSVQDAERYTPLETRDLGFFIARNVHGITIAMEHNNPGTTDEAFRQIKFIPSGMLKSIEVLVRKAPWKKANA